MHGSPRGAHKWWGTSLTWWGLCPPRPTRRYATAVKTGTEKINGNSSSGAAVARFLQAQRCSVLEAEEWKGNFMRFDLFCQFCGVMDIIIA